MQRVVDQLGVLVSLWCSINEPSIYGAICWMRGDFPTGRRGDLAALYRVMSHMHKAHELAYAAIKRRWPDAKVGLSQHKLLFLPASDKRRDHWATQTSQLALDRWPVAPARLRRIVEATSAYIGIAHYWGQMCAFDPGRPQDQFIRRFNVPGRPVTAMGLSADPGWMRAVLNELRTLRKPVYLPDNGLTSEDDNCVRRFLTESLATPLLATCAPPASPAYSPFPTTPNFDS